MQRVLLWTALSGAHLGRREAKEPMLGCAAHGRHRLQHVLVRLHLLQLPHNSQILLVYPQNGLLPDEQVGAGDSLEDGATIIGD